MSDEAKTPPVVFISYSHDSDEHKKWVRDFATALRDVGVDVILDQWKIGPGDDVPKFMEQSVQKALRVVMVCPEQYVRKADHGKGGAGWHESRIPHHDLPQKLLRGPKKRFIE
jgi:TIR domain